MPKTPRLRELRERAALSQNEFSERARVSRATIADLEAGNRSAQPRTVRRLADALGVEPEELYGEPNGPKETAPFQSEESTAQEQQGGLHPVGKTLRLRWKVEASTELILGAVARIERGEDREEVAREVSKLIDDLYAAA